uniref:Uncharacterized protein n=1 Tax=Ciona savignyi TaxID=51511 RepID=H2YM83_CIOSA
KYAGTKFYKPSECDRISAYFSSPQTGKPLEEELSEQLHNWNIPVQTRDVATDYYDGQYSPDELNKQVNDLLLLVIYKGLIKELNRMDGKGGNVEERKMMYPSVIKRAYVSSLGQSRDVKRSLENTTQK